MNPTEQPGIATLYGVPHLFTRNILSGKIEFDNDEDLAEYVRLICSEESQALIDQATREFAYNVKITNVDEYIIMIKSCKNYDDVADFFHKRIDSLLTTHEAPKG